MRGAGLSRCVGLVTERSASSDASAVADGGVSFSPKAIAVRRQLLPPTLACRHDAEFAADGRAMLALAAAACALHADA